jgi:3'-phosphoadenosine 5'-phosphosulfate sulfotransferase (PAPS reductase)/FAD synthetase
MSIDALMAKHKGHVALQFSGGRDSLALLCHMQPYLADLTVYYLDSGDAYPETRALVNFISGQVPNFRVIEGRVHDTMALYGWPSDILQSGAAWPFEGVKDSIRLNDRYLCCFNSIMLPMHRRMQEDGITLILRGQRLSDEPKSPVASGTEVEGVTIAYPIETWTDDEVMEVCGQLAPPYYAMGATSTPDCMHCTAWLEKGALPYLNTYHPAEAAVVHERLRKIQVVVQPFIEQLAGSTT